MLDIELNEELGETICDKCNGVGRDQYSMICSKCYGKKKLDWIEKVVGVPISAGTSGFSNPHAHNNFNGSSGNNINISVPLHTHTTISGICGIINRNGET